MIFQQEQMKEIGLGELLTEAGRFPGQHAAGLLLGWEAPTQ